MAPPRRPPELLEVDIKAVTPDGPSRPRMAPILALVAVVVVIGVSIGLAQAFPVGERPAVTSAISIVTAPPATASVTPAASASAPGVAARLDRKALVTGVLDGSLDGWLVYADAEVRTDCPTGTGARCSALPPRIAGLPLTAAAGNVPDGRLDPVPRQGVLVLRVAGAGFQYVGTLIAHPGGSPTLATLAAEELATPTADGQPTLRDAAGWLVVAGPCLEPPSAFLPCPRRSFLADDEPKPTGGLRTEAGTFVAVADDAWGIHPPFGAVIGGPFLVRPLAPGSPDDPDWEIVARYDPSRSVRVVIP